MNRRGFLFLTLVAPLGGQQSDSAPLEVIRIAHQILATDKRETVHLQKIVNSYRNLAPSPKRSEEIAAELSKAIRCADHHLRLLEDWRAFEFRQSQ